MIAFLNLIKKIVFLPLYLWEFAENVAGKILVFLISLALFYLLYFNNQGASIWMKIVYLPFGLIMLLWSVGIIKQDRI